MGELELAVGALQEAAKALQADRTATFSQIETLRLKGPVKCDLGAEISRRVDELPEKISTAVVKRINGSGAQNGSPRNGTPEMDVTIGKLKISAKNAYAVNVLAKIAVMLSVLAAIGVGVYLFHRGLGHLKKLDDKVDRALAVTRAPEEDPE